MAAQLGDGARAREDLQTVDKSKNLTPQDALAKLLSMQRGGKKTFWKNVQPVLVPADKRPSLQRAALRCIQCTAVLSAVNPTVTAHNHFDSDGNCKKNAAALRRAAAVTNSSKDDNSPDSEGSKRRQSNEAERIFVAPASLANAAILHVMRFIYRRGAFNMISDPDLVDAFKAVGVTLPGASGRMGGILCAACPACLHLVTYITCARSHHVGHHAHSSCYVHTC
jgi:hypothetical protein